MVPMERGASACTVALLAALLALVTTSANTPRSPRQGAARTLAPRAFAPVPLGAVRPTGWMKTQLEAQEAGLCGNGWLGTGARANMSSWIGGPGIAQDAGLAESYPYWLNGFLPLAVQLDDRVKMAEIHTQMDRIFAEAGANRGWLGPTVNGSVWSSYRFATCLGQWYEATGDARVGAAFFKYNRVLHDFLVAEPLSTGSWAQVRWQEMLVACQWLLDVFGHEASQAELDATWSLMELLVRQGFDWVGWVDSTEARPWLNSTSRDVRPWFPNNTHDADAIGTNQWKSVNRMWTHGVNLAQAMATWSALYRLTGERSYLTAGKAAWSKILRFHGQASGVFTADENIAGLQPTRGIETCAVVESEPNFGLVSHPYGIVDCCIRAH